MRFVFDFARLPGGILRRVYDEPLEWLTAHHVEEVTPLLQRVEEATQNGLHAAGFLAYEAAPAFDPAAQVKTPDEKMPLALFGLFKAPQAGFQPGPALDEACAPWQLDTEFDAYAEQISAIKEHIERGDTYQINHTLRAHSQLKGSGYALYQRLRQGQQADYSAWLDCDQYQILSLSPELFFTRHGNQIITRPMKGTARRGQMPEEDQALSQWLHESRKNRAENLMIVDLLRNDLARLSKPGAVSVPALFTIERYPTVLQMTSTVKAEVRSGTTLPQIFSALFPCGSITGAPKLKSMEIISQLEQSPRGVYCGAIGFVEPGGDATFNVAIRTLTLQTATGQLQCGLGGGITWDSDAKEEFEEVKIKSGFLTRQDSDFQLIETLRLEYGQLTYADLHLDRLEGSAKALGFPFDRTRTRMLMDAFGKDHPNGTMRVRLLHSRNGNDFIEGFPLEPNPSTAVGVSLALSPVDSKNPTLYHKTTQRQIYEKAFAAAPKGIFDVLLWNEKDELTEFTRGNVVLELEGIRYTPPISSGLLAGVFRRYLLERGDISERVLTREDLKRASKIWFINSVRDWVQVRVQ